MRSITITLANTVAVIAVESAVKYCVVQKCIQTRRKAQLSKGYEASLLNTAFVLFDVKGSDIYGWLYEYTEKFILQDFVCSDSNLSLALG